MTPNPSTDVSVEVGPNEPVVEVLPQEGKSVLVQQLRWLRFGQTAMQYDLKAIQALASSSSTPVVLQAHSDGRLYVLPPGTSAPVKRYPRQPRGFPVKPVKIMDLT